MKIIVFILKIPFYFMKGIVLMNEEKVRIIPLGGLGEIGKNITVIECDDEIIVIDCGICTSHFTKKWL